MRRRLLAFILAFLPLLPVRSVPPPGPDAFGYSVATTPAFSFTNITDATRVLFFADDDTTSVDIGFSFNFYGINYTMASFSPNGLITFGGTSTDFNNANLSSNVAPTNNLPCIAVLWDDWETEALGADALYFKTLGTPGSRQFVVQWNDVMPVNGSGTNTVTFQARLFEGSNQILLSYLDVIVSDDLSYGNGALATVGIRDTDGQSRNRNLLWSHNEAVITKGQNILFTRTNHPPLAAADSVDALENTPLVIKVLANDTDPDGNTLVVTAVTQATNGTTSNTATNLTYRPKPNFRGTDSFVYSVSDGQDGFATNSVSVTVWPFGIVSMSKRDDSTVLVQFVGIPSRMYAIQTSSNLVDWTSVAFRTADANGRFTFEQSVATPQPATFFRAMAHVSP
jgi:hypothetical protein